MRHATAFLVGLATAAALGAGCAASCGRPPDPPAADAGCEVLASGRSPDTRHHLRAVRPLMGTQFQVRVITGDVARGCQAMVAALDEVARQEALLSEYRPDSEISAINRTAGSAPVDVHPEVFALLARAQWAAEITGGAFDITFAPCGRLWSIREQRIPDAAATAACLQLVGYQHLVLDAQRSAVRFERPGMAIGLGGIGQGHGVDRAADVLRAHGLTRFLVDGGGDLLVEGHDLDGPWAVSIAHPRRPGQVYGELRLERGAIITSGDYVRFFERDGVRYHHILDPFTGRPAMASMAVTVIAPNATDADALSTGLFVLGPERGREVVERLPGVEALWFGPDLQPHTSSGFPELSPPGAVAVHRRASGAAGRVATIAPPGSRVPPATATPKSRSLHERAES